MNDSFSAAFYGVSLAWYSVATIVLGLLIMVSNGTLLWLATTTLRIRVIGCNWILINLTLADYLFGTVHALLSPITYWICYDHSSSCATFAAVCGAFKTVAVSSASLFSLLIAIHRYLKITEATSNSRWRQRIASNESVLAGVVTIWACGLTVSMVLFLNGLFGANGDGFYGLKWWAGSKSLFMNTLVYSSTTVVCRTATSFVYVCLHRYMVANESSAVRPQFRRRSRSEPMDEQEKIEKRIDKSAGMGVLKMVSLAAIIPAASAQRHPSSVNLTQLIDSTDRLDTRTLIKLIKLATLIPLVTESIVLLLKVALAMCTTDQFPSISVLRVFSLLLFVPPICNPLLCVIILRPFRQEFKRRVWPVFSRRSRNKIAVQSVL